jgi:hypothetical protein
MPKRRVPGHIQRTGRRRRDRGPNVPPIGPRDAAEVVEDSDATAAAPAVSSRPMRPTQRAAAGQPRFVRTTQPALDLTEEYRYVAGDLRQIGVLALLAFLVLGVLSFVVK